MKTRNIDWLFVLACLAFVHWVFWVFPWLFLFDKFTHPEDWIMLWDTGNLIGSGSFDKIYPGVTPNLPFMFPPYFLCLLSPLQFLTKPLALLAIAIFSGSFLLASFFMLGRITTSHRADVLKVCVISLSSASWILMWPLGQFGSFFLFFLCASLKLRMSNRLWQSGFLISLLMMKPNIGLIFPLLFLVRGEIRMFVGWAAGFGSLVFVSLMMFPASLWTNYFPMLPTISNVIRLIPPWKHHTLHAFFRSFFPPEAQAYVLAAWIFFALPLVLLTFYTWHRTRAVDGLFPRLFGIASLTIIVCSPYLHYYDAIMVLLPASIWISRKEPFHFKFSSPILGMGFLSALFIQQLSVLYVQKGLSLVSLPLAICLVTESLDMIAQNSTSQSVENPREIRT